ncbi:hypothetical protein NBH00_06095 [Paraconexibacter antarcticus]|uniref:Uncharacterized protein n=1 Tax=Paraconexibacter antarcticus TaxID=2949664 RepID=A0ABY5DUV1_9ACTN|nr:hypothetical protein [Paraconexibacter antarcticus]UTI65783.1 hypothetical protein NBH00_06095 [Paraconexibacter antarcticus]
MSLTQVVRHALWHLPDDADLTESRCGRAGRAGRRVRLKIGRRRPMTRVWTL